MCICNGKFYNDLSNISQFNSKIFRDFILEFQKKYNFFIKKLKK